MVGSIPPPATSFVGAYCSGSKTDFDSVSIGSIPIAPAKQKHTAVEARPLCGA